MLDVRHRGPLGSLGGEKSSMAFYRTVEYTDERVMGLHTSGLMSMPALRSSTMALRASSLNSAFVANLWDNRSNNPAPG
jgi:hypothetical protein